MEGMIRRSEPLTRTRYLELAYPGRDLEAEPLGVEEETMLPEQFRDR
ncbi:MAG: hypothetical protein RQ826_15880 [Xanthomonadales bacterium]|nr:hypothetical protein [Xanthomonadales bacterium]